MKNRFFTLALNSAARLAGKKGRIILLLGKLAKKVGRVNWKTADKQAIREKFLLLGRISKAYALGHYREIPWKTLLVILAAIIYFLNPLDLIPDLIPVAGLTDDFAVLLWVYNSVGTELEKFIAWEQSRTLPS